ncbi:hypothetical protein PHYPSEUDO_008268 [Phytophthora pseudosyringae]|uniref:RxLR effector protein n=1 Tax=Phytophthora pseudosyringae TaxID=221518 RepID=A0A8T1VEN0_9STRA|nr:hypothetical protein PHYPSEUDO_008268 [Phytophthora pseudosyringae]
MRVSIALLVLAAVTLFASGTCNALSTGTTSKRFLRSGENADVNDDNQEERAVNFSALKKLIPRRSSFKAAKAAKEAAKKLELAKGLDGMLSGRNKMYNQFKLWKEQGAEPSAVFATLTAAGRAGAKESEMVNQYASFLKDFTAKAT